MSTQSSLNKTIQQELLELFASIKVDKGKNSTVEKSTLIALLLEHKLDVEYPECYRYVSRSLYKLKKPIVTEEYFLQIFMNPDIDLGVCDKSYLADAFSLLDPKKTGSIDVREFLEVYTKSENYQQLSEQKRREAEDEIKEAFFSASEDGKITPMDFYHIVKFH